MQIVDFCAMLFCVMTGCAIIIIIVSGNGFTPLVLMSLTNLHNNPHFALSNFLFNALCLAAHLNAAVRIGLTAKNETQKLRAHSKLKQPYFHAVYFRPRGVFAFIYAFIFCSTYKQ
jgi:hypothetical protein